MRLGRIRKRYSGGTGRSNDPYLIATPQDLIDLGQNPNDYNKHFRLTARNHGTISGCHSSGVIAANYTIGGLVGSNDGGRMLNCHSVGEIRAKWDCVGGLAGCNSGIVLDCHSEVTITSPDGCDLGGLVGSASADSVEHSFWDIQTSGQTVSATGTGLRTSEMWDIDTFLEAGWDFVGETINGTEDIWWIEEGKGYPRLWWERNETQ